MPWFREDPFRVPYLHSSCITSSWRPRFCSPPSNPGFVLGCFRRRACGFASESGIDTPITCPLQECLAFAYNSFHAYAFAERVYEELLEIVESTESGFLLLMPVLHSMCWKMYALHGVSKTVNDCNMHTYLYLLKRAPTLWRLLFAQPLVLGRNVCQSLRSCLLEINPQWCGKSLRDCVGAASWTVKLCSI